MEVARFVGGPEGDHQRCPSVERHVGLAGVRDPDRQTVLPWRGPRGHGLVAGEQDRAVKADDAPGARAEKRGDRLEAVPKRLLHHVRLVQAQSRAVLAQYLLDELVDLVVGRVVAYALPDPFGGDRVAEAGPHPECPEAVHLLAHGPAAGELQRDEQRDPVADLGRREATFDQVREQWGHGVLEPGKGLLDELRVVPVAVPVLDVVLLDPVEPRLGASPGDVVLHRVVRGVAGDHHDATVVVGEPPQDQLRYEVVPGHVARIRARRAEPRQVRRRQSGSGSGFETWRVIEGCARPRVRFHDLLRDDALPRAGTPKSA